MLLIYHVVVLFSVRCVLESSARVAGLQPATRALLKPSRIKSPTQRTENKMTDVVIQQHSRRLLVMDISMSETC